MKKILLILSSLAVFAGLAGASVTYQTSGVFNCTNGGNLTGCGTNVLDLGTNDVVLTFVGQVSNTVNPTTGAPFGDLVVSCFNGTTGVSANCGPEVLSASVSLTITIDQTNPGTAPVALSLDATIGNGTITGNSTGTVSVSWASASTANLAGYVYSIGPLTQPLVPPSSGGPNFGDLSLQGTIINTAAPEPATFGMLGAALVGLGFLARKRKA
jgi:hypothetical protein